MASEIKLYNMDCMEAMKQMPDKVFDLCITDPPYGVNLAYKTYQDTPENLKSMVNIFMPHILRICKRAVITPGVQNVWLYPPADWIICWFYGTTNTYGKIGFNSWQPVLFYGDDPFLKNNKGARMDVIRDSTLPDKINHPCPKPMQFWKKLLNRATAGIVPTKVFDPFLGSGTTAIACYDMGFDLTGYEIDKDYFDAAVKRLENHKKQLTFI